LSDKWLGRLLNCTSRSVDLYRPGVAEGNIFEPVRIAILDTGYDPSNPLLDDGGQLDPRIKAAESFLLGANRLGVRDEVGYGTHALGVLSRNVPRYSLPRLHVNRR
jgi:hypothetical protein